MIIETCPKCGELLIDIMLTSNPPIPKKSVGNADGVGQESQKE